MTVRALRPSRLFVVLLAALPPMAVSARAETAAERSFQQARAILDASVQAAGGLDALRAVKDVSRIGRGTIFNQGQSQEPDAQYTRREVEVASLADFPRRWTATETATTPAGNIPGRGRVVLKNDTGFSFNRVTRVLTPTAAPALATARTALSRDPVIVLLTVASRAESLRFLGDAPLDGRNQQVITFADGDGTQIALYVDAQTHLVSKQETLADNSVLGDVANEILYSDYRKVGPVQVPFKVVTRTSGEVTQELTYSEIKINAGVADSFFEAPADAVTVPAAAPPTVTLTPLGDEAWLVGGGSHNSLLVAFRDHVVLVEAPLSVERTQAVLAKIKETVGDKPLRYVVPTHYHFDHSGGLRAAIAAGATIITTPGNRAFIERMAAAPHTLHPDALSREPKKPVIETFQGKRVLTDGRRTLELYDVGPTPHVKEMVIAHLPKEHVVFVADLFGIPADGPIPPAGENNRQFAATLKRLGLQGARLAPTHGRLGTADDLAQALAQPAPEP